MHFGFVEILSAVVGRFVDSDFGYPGLIERFRIRNNLRLASIDCLGEFVVGNDIGAVSYCGTKCLMNIFMKYYISVLLYTL